MRLLKYFTICPHKQIMFSNDRLKWRRIKRNIYSSISFFNGEWICHHISNWNSFSVLFIERIRNFLYFELLYQISEINFKESNVCFHSVTSTFNKRIYIYIFIFCYSLEIFVGRFDFRKFQEFSEMIDRCFTQGIEINVTLCSILWYSFYFRTKLNFWWTEKI